LEFEQLVLHLRKINHRLRRLAQIEETQRAQKFTENTENLFIHIHRLAPISTDFSLCLCVLFAPLRFLLDALCVSWRSLALSLLPLRLSFPLRLISSLRLCAFAFSSWRPWRFFASLASAVETAPTACEVARRRLFLECGGTTPL
jgi:hypothetical protein